MWEDIFKVLIFYRWRYLGSERLNSFFKIRPNLGLESGSNYYYFGFWFFFLEAEEIVGWMILTLKIANFYLHFRNYSFHLWNVKK